MTDDSIVAVLAAIRGLGRRDVVAVALDGFSGSGKSTLASELAGALDSCVLEGDDFYCEMDEVERWALSAPEGVDRYFDWQRLRDEALVPLRTGHPAVYSPYDWVAGGGLSSQVVSVGPAPVIVVDGVYSSRPELSHLIDLAVFVQTTEQSRDERITSRNHGNDRWHSRWAAAEAYYFVDVRPPGTFDLVVRGE